MKTTTRKTLTKLPQALFLTAITLILLTSNSWANEDRSGERQGRRGGPPQEAIDACSDKSTGDIVEFEGRRGDTIKGTCTEKDGQLIAVPEGKGQGRRGGR